MLATTQGKEFALKALQERRIKNATREKIDNSRLPAGSPMYYDCLGCGGIIAMPEGWFLSKPNLCEECHALKTLDWLE